MPKRQSGNKKGKQSNFAKLSIFQPNKYKFKKTCPLSVKGAPEVDYKNIKLLKKYPSLELEKSNFTIVKIVTKWLARLCSCIALAWHLHGTCIALG